MPENILNQYEKDGYVVLEDFLRPDECDELLAAGLELTNMAADSSHKTIFATNNSEKEHLNDSYFIDSNENIHFFYELDALGPDGSLKVDKSVSLNKVGHALHFLHPTFRRYTYTDKVKDVCKEFGYIEPAVVQSMYIFKNPGLGGEVKPHQDATYLYTENKTALGFWIALEDATIQNGCLWMAPGSHKTGLHRRLSRNTDKESKELLIYDKPPKVYPESIFTPVPISKGSCIIFHGNMVHQSAHNTSDKSRHAYSFHVVERHNNPYSPANWLQEGKKAPFINLYTASQTGQS